MTSIRSASAEPAPAPWLPRSARCRTHRRETAAVLAAALFLLPGCADRSRGQAPDYTTNIFLLDLEEHDGRLRVGRPVDLTHREGYDNQPAFLPDGQALLYASRERNQVEIRRYDLARGASESLTRTAEREYQPLPLPAGGGFSVVRVESDGRQRLWRFDARGGQASTLLESVNNVYAYAWIDPRKIAIVDTRDPRGLWLFDLPGGRGERIAEGVGRSIQRVPGRSAISFVHQIGPDEGWITTFDLDTGERRRLVLARPGSEDHAWTPSGLLVMAQGSRLFQWTPGPDSGWKDWNEIGDFSPLGLRQISRVTVSPDGGRLAFVSREAEKR